MSAVDTITATIIEEIEAQAQTDLYSQFRDEPERVLVDGNLNVTALAQRLRPLLEAAWEKGMADAKLQALGIKSHVRNPYLPEGE